jgi:amino acid adenylation domain-containing protein
MYMAKGAKIQNIYPLTPMQQGMLFNYLCHKDSKAYFQQLCFSLEADLDIDVFERSVNKVIERYDVLRTIFVYEKVEEPKQVVLAERTTKVFYEDISCMDSRDRKGYVEELKRNDLEKGFDIAKDLLMRISIIKVGSKVYEVIWSHHHMVLDGWCLGVVISDFIKIYQSLKYGKEHNLTKPYQYVDYINWLTKQDNATALAYWEKYLENYENEILLPQKVNVMKECYDKKEIHFSIDQEVTSKIVDISRKNNVTLNHVFQAIWAILLQRYNRVEDVVFGAVVSGRNAPIDGIDRMVGLFINTIPIRVNCDEHRSFTGMLEYIRDTYNQSILYDFVSLAKIQSQCSRKQNLINQLFIFENYPARDQSMGDTYRIKDAQSFEQTNYDFNLVIVPSDEIHIKLKYNGFLYEDKMVEAIQGHILQIINSICDNPDIQLKDIGILTDCEYDQIVYELNPNTRNTICNSTIKEMFEEQVVKSPDTIAVVYQNKKITYRELNERSNSLARVLRYHGVKKDTLVALMTERSIEMIIGILAILKAGGAYLPIDPEYPAQRVQYMLEDSNAKIIMTNTELKGILFEGEILDLRQEALYTKHHINLENSISPSDLAYTIYTSGTTGKPKGVMIENGSVVNLSANIYRKIYSKYSSILNVALLSPYVFDASVKQIFPSLLYGQTLVIVPEEERMDGEKLVNYYMKHRIDLSDGTPAHLGIIHEVLQSSKYRLPTRHFLIGGEELSVDLVRDFFSIYGTNEIRITNVYGPTECCDVSTMYDVDLDNIGKLSRIPIGYPLENVQIYLLDRNLNPVPYDIPGEIFIAGDGVSRGYLNQK